MYRKISKLPEFISSSLAPRQARTTDDYYYHSHTDDAVNNIAPIKIHLPTMAPAKPHHHAVSAVRFNQSTRASSSFVIGSGLHRPSTPPGLPPPTASRSPSKLSFGTVCSSNINRSMEAHVVLSNAGEKIIG